MKILALADEPCKAFDYQTKERLADIDLILSCGDLPASYLEYLACFTTVPILYVPGNHDGRYRENPPGGCFCVDNQIYHYRGLRIFGLGGSIRYNKDDGYQYTEFEMKMRIVKMRFALHKSKGFDILLTHSPARGLNDEDDPAHRGFECFNPLLDAYRPSWFVHGHVHLNYGQNIPRVCEHNSTTVINACERYIFEIPDPVRPKKGAK